MVDDGNEDFIDIIKEIIKKKFELFSRKMASILGLLSYLFVFFEIEKKSQLIDESHMKKSYLI